MKKIISILLSVFLMLMFGCQTNIETNEMGTKQEEVSYTVYQNAASAVGVVDIIDADGLPENVKIGDIAEIDFSFFSKEETVACDNKMQKIDVKLGEREVQLPIFVSFASKLYLDSDIKLKPYGLITVYKDESSEIRCNEKGYLKTYTVFDEEFKNEVGTFGVEESKIVAEKVIKQLYGEQLANKYRFKCCFETETGKSVSSILYERQWCGYDSTDTIQISFNGKGEIVGITANYVGIYDEISTIPTQKEVANAEAVLMQVIPKDMNVGDKTLVIDSTGKMFLRVRAQKTIKQETYEPVLDAREYYINIQ